MTNYLEKFEKMRISGKLASQTLDMLTDYVKPGISTDKIDQLGYEFINDNGGHSAPLYYRGFKKSLCTSLNHVVCHGIPSDRVLNEGDAVNIDVTAIVEGYHGDTVMSEALNLLLILHADHEQNCSTSTVRMAGSSQANLYATISSGISALWGPRHGGANQAVIEMLEMIHADGGDYQKYINLAKSILSAV